MNTTFDNFLDNELSSCNTSIWNMPEDRTFNIGYSSSYSILALDKPTISEILESVSEIPDDFVVEKLRKELKNILEFQKEAVYELESKSKRLIDEILWQTEILIQKVETQSLAKALEIKALILQVGNQLENTRQRRDSRIMRVATTQNLLTFSLQIAPISINWIKMSSLEINWSQGGLETLFSSGLLSNRATALAKEIVYGQNLNRTELMVNRRLTDESAREISHFLPWFTNAKSLKVSSTDITGEGSKYLASSLQDLKKIEFFSVNFQKAKNGIGMIGLVLPRLENLTELYLSCEFFNEEETRDLGFGLSFVNELKALSVLGGVLGESGAKYLTYGLKELKNLVYLDLSGNSLGPTGTEIVCKSIEGFRRIECLKLASNYISAEGASFVAGVVKGFAELREINLSSNYLEEGVVVLAKSLENLGNLRVLEIEDNGIEGNGVLALAKVLKDEGCLMSLNVAWNPIGDKGLKEIANSLKKLKGFDKLIAHGVTGNTKIFTKTLNKSVKFLM